jgi:amino acid adenylation domain-containing protein
MTIDSNRLDGMDANAKRELLARLLRERATGSGEEFELSSGQEALWFLYELAPDSAAYNVHFCARVRSEVDRERLEHALLKLMERHAMLRCTIFRSAQGPRQRIGQVPERCLEVVDASGWAEEELKARVAESYALPFDLTAGPVFRCTLFSQCPTEHVLLLCAHHIFSDASSFGVLVSDLMTLYDKGPTALAPLPANAYADYVNWKRETIDSAEGRQAWEYWQARLKDLPSTRLPADYPRPKMQSFRGASHRFELPVELCDAMRAFARAHDATPFMVAAAALHVLLVRYCGSSLVPIGTPLAGRSRQEDEGTVGYFINPVVLCAPVQPETTFRQHLADMRAAVIGAQRFGDFPFPELVKRLQPVRDTSEMPIFQVLLNLIKGSQVEVYKGIADVNAQVKVGSLVLQAFSEMQEEGQFDLVVGLFDAGSAIPAIFNYRTDLFEAATIKRMAANFQTLLSAAVADPELRISDLPLLTDAERQQVLYGWNDTQVDFPADQCLQELFEAQVEQTPEAVAVEFAGSKLTYRDLNERANQLAHYLRGQGVEPDTLVAVCMERSLEMIVALYGVLKAGAAYVPIDPEYPQERLSFMLQDAETPVLLTQSRLVGGLPAHAGHIMCLDTEWDRIAQEDVANPTWKTEPGHLAYMIYTSGSTGKPKGAMNTHRGICNRLLWMQGQYGLTPADKVLQKTPFSFDVSVWEFFWPLLVGARLVVAQPGGHRDAAYLVKLIREAGITVLHFVPSMLRVFLEEPGVEGCQSLQQVMCSGEALPYDLQEQFFKLSAAQLHNLYGPTEAAVDVTHWTCRRGDERKIVPIGRPVANTQVYILDRHLQPVPVGVAGELHLGGVQVGRGYRNRPELTAEKFIPDPFSTIPGAKLYKTGDLCRWLPDGVVEYLGRMDFQVKIRGFRIELGEIEAILGEHPLVKNCAVIADERLPGEKRLLAYLVLAEESGSATAELREYLKQKLPEYMVPAAWVTLTALPLNPNGKLDRKALPAPDLSQLAQLPDYVAPRNQTEETLARLWSEILGVERVGIHDDFFELGGHSLLVTQLTSRSRKVFGIDIPLRRVFQSPTVAQLAEYVQNALWTSQASTAPLAALGANRQEGEL